MEELKDFCTQVRRDIVRMVHAANSGHPGGSLGCVEFFAVLFKKIMKHDPYFNENGINEDLFFLSNGHISPVYYSILARTGYFTVYELSTFRKINSRLQGHPANHEHLPGIRVASGSLGQGLSVAVGAALTKKLNSDNRLVYSLHGDGELQEGQIWEAAMYAGANGVDNLISTIDANGRQIDGNTNDVLPLGSISKKFNAFGWDVIQQENGNDLDAVYQTLIEAKRKSGNGKPIAIVLKTEMGHGVDYMMGTHSWHGKAPNDEQLKIALEQNPITLGDY